MEGGTSGDRQTPLGTDTSGVTSGHRVPLPRLLAGWQAVGGQQGPLAHPLGYLQCRAACAARELATGMECCSSCSHKCVSWFPQCLAHCPGVEGGISSSQRRELSVQRSLSQLLGQSQTSPSGLCPCLAGSRGEEVSEEDPQIDIATVQDMLSSHHYKSFKVSMIHRLRFTTDVQLGKAACARAALSPACP